MRRGGLLRNRLYCVERPLGAKEAVGVGDVGSLVVFVEAHSSLARPSPKASELKQTIMEGNKGLHLPSRYCAIGESLKTIDSILKKSRYQHSGCGRRRFV